jgi:hypothetical protein
VRVIVLDDLCRILPAARFERDVELRPLRLASAYGEHLGGREAKKIDLATT